MSGIVLSASVRQNLLSLQSTADLLLRGRHPLPQVLGILAVVSRERNDLIGLGFAVTEDHVPVKIVALRSRGPLVADERREPPSRCARLNIATAVSAAMIGRKETPRVPHVVANPVATADIAAARMTEAKLDLAGHDPRRDSLGRDYLGLGDFQPARPITAPRLPSWRRSSATSKSGHG